MTPSFHNLVIIRLSWKGFSRQARTVIKKAIPFVGSSICIWGIFIRRIEVVVDDSDIAVDNLVIDALGHVPKFRILASEGRKKNHRRLRHIAASIFNGRRFSNLDCIMNDR